MMWSASPFAPGRSTLYTATAAGRAAGGLGVVCGAVLMAVLRLRERRLPPGVGSAPGRGRGGPGSRRFADLERGRELGPGDDAVAVRVQLLDDPRGPGPPGPAAAH